jgi:hypothetical protein
VISFIFGCVNRMTGECEWAKRMILRQQDRTPSESQTRPNTTEHDRTNSDQKQGTTEQLRWRSRGTDHSAGQNRMQRPMVGPPPDQLVQNQRPTETDQRPTETDQIQTEINLRYRQRQTQAADSRQSSEVCTPVSGRTHPRRLRVCECARAARQSGACVLRHTCARPTKSKFHKQVTRTHTRQEQPRKRTHKRTTEAPPTPTGEGTL